MRLEEQITVEEMDEIRTLLNLYLSSTCQNAQGGCLSLMQCTLIEINCPKDHCIS